jgi:hypothetical protein
MVAHRIRTGVPILLAVASSILFFVLGAWALEFPGLQYDEVLFVNGALGGITESFIHRRLFGIPVMLMPYIGALKSYVFAPIFALLEVSVETIRLPSLLISTLSVILGYRLGERLSGNRWLGASFALVMATDPIFVFMSRADYGPVVLMIFLKLAGLVALFELLRTQRSRFAWLFSITLVLGLFDKLNFVWIVAAILVSAAAVYRIECAAIVRNRTWSFLGAAALLLTGVAAAGVLISRLAPSGAMDWPTRLPHVRSLYDATMGGQAINEMMLAADTMPSSPAVSLEVPIAAVLVLILVLWIVSRWTGSKGPLTPAHAHRGLTFVVLTFGLILVQLILTPEATGPHHIMTLWPFHHLVGLLGAAVLMDHVARFLAWRRPRYGRFVYVASAVLVGVTVLVVAVSQVRVVQAYNDALERSSRLPPIWTTSIYPLTDYVSSASNVDAVICVDWGICNQVLSLVPSVRAKNQDLWPVFAEMDKAKNDLEIFDRFFRGRRVMILAHLGHAILMPAAHDNFERFAAVYLNNPGPSNIIRDGAGDPVFAVYEVAPGR